MVKQLFYDSTVLTQNFEREFLSNIQNKHGTKTILKLRQQLSGLG